LKENLQIVINGVSGEFDLTPGKWNREEFTLQLARIIEELIARDFPRLINILYRLDVDEQKLKNELKDNPGSPAGLQIANLIVERQLEKLKTRKQTDKNVDIPDNERW
jgi:hypothetical protein